MHQVRFRLRLRPRPSWGAYSVPRPLAGFKGPTANEKEEKKRGWKEREGMGKGKAGKENGDHLPLF